MFSIRHTSPLCNRSGNSAGGAKCLLKQSESSTMLSYSSSQAEVSMAVNLIFRRCFICIIITFRRKCKQEFSTFLRLGISREVSGKQRKSVPPISFIFHLSSSLALSQNLFVFLARSKPQRLKASHTFLYRAICTPILPLSLHFGAIRGFLVMP